jgi:hypothetical protein
MLIEPVRMEGEATCWSNPSIGMSVLISRKNMCLTIVSRLSASTRFVPVIGCKDIGLIDDCVLLYTAALLY